MTILENKFNSKLFEFRRNIFSEATFLLHCTLGTAHKLRNGGKGGGGVWNLKKTLRYFFERYEKGGEGSRILIETFHLVPVSSLFHTSKQDGSNFSNKGWKIPRERQVA